MVGDFIRLYTVISGGELAIYRIYPILPLGGTTQYSGRKPPTTVRDLGIYTEKSVGDLGYIPYLPNSPTGGHSGRKTSHGGRIRYICIPP